MLMLLVLFLVQQQPPQSTLKAEHFIIRHDKNLPAKVVKAVAAALETELASAETALGVKAGRKIPVTLYTSALRYRSDSKSAAFEDGDAKGGVIHLSYPALQKDREVWGNVMARVVTKALLSEQLFCPPWLVDAYALRAGDETGLFGDPARVSIASFGDLFEEYNRAERPRDVREVYAKLGFTIDFLVERFGAEKVRTLVTSFRDGRDPESVFTTVFGEPAATTEAAWAAALRAAARR
jgi:hypothetical protein